MKILLNHDNVIIVHGNEVVTQPNSNDLNYLVDSCIAFSKSDISAVVEVGALPNNFAEGLFKYEDGEIVPYVSVQNALIQEGYDAAIADILGV